MTYDTPANAKHTSAPDWKAECEHDISYQKDGGANYDAYTHGTMRLHREWINIEETLEIEPRRAIAGIEEHVRRQPGFIARKPMDHILQTKQSPGNEGGDDYNGLFDQHVIRAPFHCNGIAGGPALGGGQCTRWDQLWIRDFPNGSYGLTILPGSTGCDGRGIDIQGGNNRQRQGMGLKIIRGNSIRLTNVHILDVYQAITLGSCRSCHVQAKLEKAGAIAISGSGNHLDLYWREGPQLLFDFTEDQGGNTIRAHLTNTRGPFYYKDRKGIEHPFNPRDFQLAHTEQGTVIEIRTAWRKRFFRRWRRDWTPELTTNNGEIE